jgi:hypothetical protein
MIEHAEPGPTLAHDERSPTSIVPYGRSFSEYCLMFGLSDAHASARILGVGDGPSDFNARASAQGWRVVSVDPTYRYASSDLAQRCQAVVDTMTQAVSMVPTHWTWSRHESIASLREHRLQTTHNFLQDFESTASSGRYVAAALPVLPFRSNSFDIAICAHLLFSWSGVLDLTIHLQSVLEMLRVAPEVRMFPTGRNLSSRRSKYADAVVAHVLADGHHARFQSMHPGRPDASAECLIISRAPATIRQS